MYSPNPNYWDCYLKPLLSNYIKVQYSSDGLKIIFRCYFLLIFGKSPLPSSLRWQKEITNNECHYQIGDRTCRNKGMKTQTFHLCYLLYPYYFYYWLLSRYILSFSFSIHTFHLKKKNAYWRLQCKQDCGMKQKTSESTLRSFKLSRVRRYLIYK